MQSSNGPAHKGSASNPNRSELIKRDNVWWSQQFGKRIWFSYYLASDVQSGIVKGFHYGNVLIDKTPWERSNLECLEMPNDN